MSGVDSLKLEQGIYKGWEDYHAGGKNAIDDIYDLVMPFCLRVCAKTCRRYVDESDEEASICRLALLEAFETYDPQKGQILVYIGRVVKNRLIDYLRRERSRTLIPLLDNLRYRKIDAELVDEELCEKIVEDLARKQDIEMLKELINEYGISLEELVAGSPKQARTRKEACTIADEVAEMEEYRNYLTSKKKLPVSALEKQGYNRKLIDRYRKHIITSSLIIIYNLTTLKPYILSVKGGGDFAE